MGTSLQPTAQQPQGYGAQAAPLALAPRPKAPLPSAQQAASIGLATPNAAPTTTTGAASSATAPAAPSNGQVTTPDRVTLANQALQTSAAATDPYYQKSLRDAASQAASVGQLGSGQLRTSLGDLANTRALELDTLRSNAINTATNASIDDAFKARDQGLAAGQLDLATRLGEGNLGIAQQQADTSQTGVLGNLSLQQRGQDISANQGQQSLDLQQRAQDIQSQYQNGTLSLQQAQLALSQLQNTQQYGLAQSNLDLANRAQTATEANQAGQLDLANRTQAANQGNQTDQLALANRTQTANEANAANQLQFQRDQLAQVGQQFNLSLDQQKQLATLADKTQNRQIDVSSQQGQTALLVQLAQILGTSTNSIPGSLVQGILAALHQVPPVNGGGTVDTGGTRGTGQTGKGTSGGGSTDGSTDGGGGQTI